jgi:hypothetical protein
MPAAAWILVARGVVPTLIREAYQGRSLPLLDRVVLGRGRHPVEHYLDLWRTYWQALLLAWLFHLVVVLVVRAAGPGRKAGDAPEDEEIDRAVDLGLIGFALAFLFATVLSGPRQDYVAFLEIWRAVRAGRDPWWIHERWGYPLHAYGPLFNLLAVPAGWNALAPKLLFALAYCLVAVWLLKGETAAGRSSRAFPPRGLLGWLIGPFAWVEVAYFGHFDVLAAIACVIAVDALCRGRETLAGASLAVGFLLKLIPAVIVPFLALEARDRDQRPRIRVPLPAGALVPMGLGYLASVLIWGPATFRPFRFAATRGSTLLSIFRFLRGGASPLRRFTAHPDLDAWSMPCLVAALLLVLLVCLRRRLDPATSAPAAVLTTLLFYRVGFPQYQMFSFLLMAYWLVRRGDSLWRRRGLAVAVLAYFGWLTLFDLFYVYAGGVLHAEGPFGRVDDWVGLPTFLLGGFLLVELMGCDSRAPRQIGETC